MDMVSAPARPLPAASTPDNHALSEAEQVALLASLGDGRTSLAPAIFRWPLVRAFFGFGPPVRLAAARLEALRRYAVLYRFEGAALPMEEDERLRDAGFSDRQAEAARALVDAQSPNHCPPAPTGVATVAAALLGAGAVAAFLIDRWLARQVDDTLGAHLLTILLVTWLVSIIAITGHPHPRRLRS